MSSVYPRSFVRTSVSYYSLVYINLTDCQKLRIKIEFVVNETKTYTLVGVNVQLGSLGIIVEPNKQLLRMSMNSLIALFEI